jgi:hypothetical protein
VDEVSMLSDALKSASSLTSLNFNLSFGAAALFNPGFGTELAIKLSEALKLQSSLTSLNFIGNIISVNFHFHSIQEMVLGMQGYRII